MRDGRIEKGGRVALILFFPFFFFFFFLVTGPPPSPPPPASSKAERQAFTSNHSTGMVTHITSRFLPQRPLQMTLSYWHGVLFQKGGRDGRVALRLGRLKELNAVRAAAQKVIWRWKPGGFWQWVHCCLADMSGFRGRVESCSRDSDKALLLSALSSWWWRFPSKLHELHLQNKKTTAESVFSASMCRNHVGHAAVWTLFHFQHKIS